MTEVILYIIRNGDRNLPEKMEMNAEVDFFKEGEKMELPNISLKSGVRKDIKIIKVEKQISTGNRGITPRIVVHAERC